ncbi:MAG: hypothetical protein ACSI46_29400 [Gloeotrichia echinulata DVL01]|jgi:hypothetical protein|nr:hypothetical protein [Gloeotrichia echinulata DEX184]
MRMFEKFCANIIRYYTGIVHRPGLTQNQDFQPRSLGFVRVAAIYNRQGWYGEFRIPSALARGV